MDDVSEFNTLQSRKHDHEASLCAIVQRTHGSTHLTSGEACRPGLVVRPVAPACHSGEMQRCLHTFLTVPVLRPEANGRGDMKQFEFLMPCGFKPSWPFIPSSFIGRPIARSLHSIADSGREKWPRGAARFAQRVPQGQCFAVRFAKVGEKARHKRQSTASHLK